MTAEGRDGRLVVLGVGDIGPYYEPVADYRRVFQATLDSGDVRFAHCEKVFSARGYLQVHGDGHYSRQDPDRARTFEECGFNVVSIAGNKAMDWGAEAMLDTIELFDKMGIQAIGGGRNAEEARRPAIVEKNGVKVAFLAYSCILREGYAATEHRAGTAPLRVHTFYVPEDWQPGTPPRVVTYPWEDDLAAFRADIARTKPLADAVIVSVHMGIHNIPRVLADYQRTVARAAFEAGADLIFGHHPHIPKGIEVFGGKVCFYSLSHFLWSQRELGNHVPGHVGGHRHGVQHDPAYPRLPMGPDAMKSMIGRAEVTRRGIERVSFHPVRIDTDLRPEVLFAGDPRFEAAVGHLEWASEGLPHRFVIDGDQVLVTGPQD
jgi:Bacterial capsule synthesis protein PGA_cap